MLASSVVEALATPHGVDRYLEMINPAWALDEVRAKITVVRHLTADTVTLTLRPNGNWRGFRAGQFVRLSVEIDGTWRMRCFSPADSVHRADGCLELTMKVQPDGLVTGYLKTHAAPGMIVRLSQADGEFFLPTPRPRRILLISGGSGITPVMAMLRTLCDEAFNGKVTFLHYARSAADQLYATELAAIEARYPSVKIVRAYNAPGGQLTGLFCREHLVAADPHFAEAETFLCGPPPMMAAVQALYAAEGLSDRLHLEQFTASAPVVVADAEGTVSFTRTGSAVANTGRTLLEQAEEAGLTPESGCRMGICFSCTRVKETGCVRNVLTGEVSGEADEAIQICINVPVGDVTLDL